MSTLRELDKTMDRAHSQGYQEPVMADDILAKMRMGKRTVSEIRMGDQVIPVRILSADEVNDIRHKARAENLRKGGDETDENLLIQKLTLYLSSTVDSSGIPFFTDVIMSKLLVDEIGYLYKELIQFWDTFNPSLETITPERFRQLVDALKKNTISWNDCSTPERKAIFICFQDMIQRQDSQTSPPGS